MPIEPDDCLGYQKLTVSNVGTALTVPSGAGAALVQPQTADIVWREDSLATAVGPGTGLTLAAGATPYRTTSPSSFRAIRAGTVDATLHVLYYEA